MGVLEKIKEIEAEMARTQKNKVRHNFDLAFIVSRISPYYCC
jgi:ribosome-interacting GTPase 1